MRVLVVGWGRLVDEPGPPAPVSPVQEECDPDGGAWDGAGLVTRLRWVVESPTGTGSDARHPAPVVVPDVLVPADESLRRWTGRTS